MKGIFKQFALALAVLSLSGCDYWTNDIDRLDIKKYYLLTIYNNSSETTVWVFPEHGDVDCDKAGDLPSDLNAEGSTNAVITLGAKCSKSINIIKDDNKSAFETYHIDDKLPVYVFSKEDIDNIPWAQLKSEEKWLATYSLSVEDVLKANQMIEYRP